VKAINEAMIRNLISQRKEFMDRYKAKYGVTEEIPQLTREEAARRLSDIQRAKRENEPMSAVLQVTSDYIAEDYRLFMSIRDRALVEAMLREAQDAVRYEHGPAK